MKSELFIFENPLALLVEAWYHMASSVAVVLGSRKEQVPWHM